ncbi:MAG TPA: hypothetical protein VFC84_15220 [Desulfosporosinus sp.]|nr:hypothetical protein [Desulfosporosinus sp.]
MRKTVIIINGIGGVGKDTICGIVSQLYSLTAISSIDPIKQIASLGGWSYDDKSLAGRKLLSDIKLAFVCYNDLPNKYLLDEYKKFLKDKHEILFVHIREPEEINKFRRCVKVNCISLLIKSPRINIGKFGNPSDDCVENYQYDYIYNNIKPLSELSDDFLIFFSKIILTK